VVLYGHTHQADCRQEQGIWMLNPGTCGSWGGTVGVITVENGQVIQCTILDQKDLEEQT
jgi:predicted phosphodiesterase